MSLVSTVLIAPAMLLVRLLLMRLVVFESLPVTPSKCPISVAVTALTATLPEPLDTKALEAVKSEVVIVLTAPAILFVRLVSTAALFAAATVTFALRLVSNPSICVCIALVTPST